MITLKTAVMTLLAATTLVGTTVLPASAQRYDHGRGNRQNARQEQGQVRWSGNVDDTAVITIRGRDERARTTSGNGTSNVSAQVDGQLPNRPVNVELRRVSGRGQVTVIEQPNARNNYTARVRVRDSQGGSARYSFVLDWRR